MNKALENSLMRLLAMGNLIEPLARLQGEIRFVNEFKFENQNIKISDEKAIQGLMIELKIRDRKGRAKHCSGYESFPRKFKELIKELNVLFGSNIVG